MSRTCKFCGEFAIKSGSNHVKTCKKNPESVTNSQKNLEIRRRAALLSADRKFGEKRIFNVFCDYCGRPFEIEAREKSFDAKHRYFCSRSCANSRGSFGGEVKKVFCKCGASIIVGRRANAKLCRCRLCKQNEAEKRKRDQDIERVCSCCGAKSCKDSKICKKIIETRKTLFCLGFNPNVLGTEQVYTEYERIRELVRDEYYERKLSSNMLSEKYECDFGNVLMYFGFSPRSASESIRLAYKAGRLSVPIVDSDRFRHGYHTSWDGKSYFYRSSYELEYAKSLDEAHVEYQMNVLRLQYWDSRANVERTAEIDFYLPKSQELIEIKSDWDYDELNLLDRKKSFESLGYCFRVLLERKEKILPV